MRHVAPRCARKACIRSRSRGASRRAHVHHLADQWTRHGRAAEAEPGPRLAEFFRAGGAGVGLAKRPRRPKAARGVRVPSPRCWARRGRGGRSFTLPPCPAIRRQATSECSSARGSRRRVISFAALSRCHRSGREPRSLETLAARPERASDGETRRRSLASTKARARRGSPRRLPACPSCMDTSTRRRGVEG